MKLKPPRKLSITFSGIIIFIIFIGGFALGLSTYYFIAVRNNHKSKPEVEITRDTIVHRVSEQGFLVTRVAVLDQEVEIKVNDDSSWSKFWWGHEVTAEAQMQVDMGVDLSNISKKEIQINEETKEIQIDIPEAEIYNISLKDEDIEIATKSGVLKKIFDNNKEEDFNLALQELEESTLENISSNEEMLNEAQKSAKEIIKTLFTDTNYTVNIK
jgi:hypothetical protein